MEIGVPADVTYHRIRARIAAAEAEAAGGSA
jgi:hypothetical protein